MRKDAPSSGLWKPRPAYILWWTEYGWNSASLTLRPGTLYSTPPTPTTFIAALLILSLFFQEGIQTEEGLVTWGERQMRGGDRVLAHVFISVPWSRSTPCAVHITCPSWKGLLPALTPCPEKERSDSTYLQECPDFPNPSGDLGICVAVQSRGDRRKRCYRDKKRTDESRALRWQICPSPLRLVSWGGHSQDRACLKALGENPFSPLLASKGSNVLGW